MSWKSSPPRTPKKVIAEESVRFIFLAEISLKSKDAKKNVRILLSGKMQCSLVNLSYLSPTFDELWEVLIVLDGSLQSDYVIDKAWLFVSFDQTFCMTGEFTPV